MIIIQLAEQDLVEAPSGKNEAMMAALAGEALNSPDPGGSGREELP